MKRIYLFLVLTGMLFCLVDSFAQAPQLTFRMTNPRIVYTDSNTTAFLNSPADNLEFDIEVKCDSANTRYFALQFIFTGDLTAVTDLDFALDPTYAPATKYGYGATMFSGNLNITITAAKGATWPNPTNFSILPTSFSKIGTAFLRILDPSKVANIAFIQSSMNGQEFQKIFGSSPTTRLYGNPQSGPPPLGINTFTGTDFTNLFLGRIYSSGSGWSQVGGTTLYAQYLNWNTAVNTSVWDTAYHSPTTAATLSATGAMASGLRIHQSARLKITNTGQLTCTGATEINEAKGLWIVSDASGSGSYIDNGTITYNTGGTARIDRYFSMDKWHSWSMPVTQMSASAFYTPPTPSIYMEYYDEPNHKYKWVVGTMGTGDTLLTTKMLGYQIWSSHINAGNYIAQLTGSLNTGPENINLTRTAYPGAPGLDFDGWNLSGNPYPSAIDMEASSGWTWTNAYSTAYIWSQSGTTGNYQYYIKGSPGTSNHTQYIPAQQGFFIKVDSTQANGNLALTNAARVQNPEPFLKSSPALNNLLTLNVTGNLNSYSDQAIIYFNEYATNGYDPQTDAYKLQGDASAPQLYSILSTCNLASNTLPWAGENTTVPVGFHCGLNGHFTISAGNIASFREGTGIYLKDIKLNYTQDLTVNPDYSFDYATSDNSGRFLLIFYNPFLGIQEASIQNIQIFSFDENVYVKNLSSNPSGGGLITIFDLMGRKVFEDKLENNALNKYYPGVTEGYYLVRVITKEASYNQKVYIR